MRPRPTGPSHSRVARWGWPIAIVLVLALSAGANIAIMVVARSDKAFAIEPDYYDKAIRWDETMAQERRNLELGWKAAAALTLARPGVPGEIRVTLRDERGGAVDGAVVSVIAMHNARASKHHDATLVEREPGIYRGVLDAVRPGEWEIRLTAQRDADRFTRALRVSAPLE